MIRNSYFDYLRAVAIIMVVGIHCYINDDKNEYLYFIRNIFNCAVPLFFAISGFFLGQKDISTTSKYWSFLKVQVPKVYIPMLVWSVPFILVYAYSGANMLPKLKMFFIGGLGVFYFITVIIQYYFLLPFLIKIIDRLRLMGVIMSFFVSEVSVTVVTYFHIVQGMKIPLVIYAGFFPLWLVFYMSGIYLGRCSDRKYSIWPSCAFVVIGLLLSQLEALYFVVNYNAGLGIKPSSFLYSFALVFLLLSYDAECFFTKALVKARKLLIYLGSISFGIYLVHLHIKNHIAARTTDSWFLRWCITLGISVILIWLLKRYVPLKYHKYLGF